MRQFERFRTSSAWTPGDEPEFPADFSADEMEFADELQDLFPVAREELPPRYLQTLLESERVAAAEPGFEEQLTYQVFRRLQLRRDLALGGRPRWRPWMQRALRPLRPMAGAVAAVLVLMVVTMVLATPSFADGLRLIFGQTGVVQTQRYPTHVQSYGTHGSMGHAAAAATLDPTMPLEWLGRTNGRYLYRGVRLEDATVWSKGAIVDLQYQVDGEVQGTGLLDIREFQINPKDAAVLQVVQTPYATPATVGNNIPAVYVDGIWMPRSAHPVMDMSSGDPSAPFIWESGTRSELIFELGNVIYWMVGDQRDGMDQSELVRLAGELTAVKPATLQFSRVALSMAGYSLSSSFDNAIEGHELYEVVPRSAVPGGSQGWFVASTS
jgi:hypothetical protein